MAPYWYLLVAVAIGAIPFACLWLYEKSERRYSEQYYVTLIQNRDIQIEALKGLYKLLTEEGNG